MRIVFFGTPQFAVASLEAIIKNHFDVVAVVTAPDKPAGRGMKLQESPVKTFALQHNIPVLQPVKLKDPAFQEELRNFKPDLGVVIAFRMLPESVWNMPKLGTINLHASLLPDYRGAAPINWAIINGESETGVTTFFLKHEIDTGDIIARSSFKISDNMNAGELHDNLMIQGADLMIKTLQMIESGEASPLPQLHSHKNKVAPKIFTEDCKINWHQSGKEIRNRIRGLSPYPAAFSKIGEIQIKILSAEFHPGHSDQPGTINTNEKGKLLIACSDGWMEIKELQPQGKKKMTGKDFMNGYRHSS